MTKKEIEERIIEIENTLFIIDMSDRWTSTDMETMRTLEREKRQLKEQLEKR